MARSHFIESMHLDIDYSQFIRTTDKQHEEIVQKIFDKLLKQGDIYMVSFDDTIGCEQSGVRPALIIQNDWGNECSPTTIILPITPRTEAFRT